MTNPNPSNSMGLKWHTNKVGDMTNKVGDKCLQESSD